MNDTRLAPGKPNCYNVSTMGKLKYILIALVAVLVIAGYFAAHRDLGSDREQILATINTGREGIQEKNLEKTMTCISPNYKDIAGNDYDRLRIFGMEIFRSEKGYNVKISDPKIVVRGDDAEASAKVGVTFGGGDGSSVYPTRDITLHFKKEPTRQFLLYHAPRWKVISMENAVPTMDTGF